jgi:hypothetical protein
MIQAACKGAALMSVVVQVLQHCHYIALYYIVSCYITAYSMANERSKRDAGTRCSSERGDETVASVHMAMKPTLPGPARRTPWPRTPGLQVSTRTQLAMGSRAIADGRTALSAHSNKCAHVHCKGWPNRLSSRDLPVPLALTKAGMWEELTVTKPDGVAMLRTEPLVMGRPDGAMVVGGLSLLCGEPMTAIWPPGPSGNTG